MKLDTFADMTGEAIAIRNLPGSQDRFVLSFWDGHLAKGNAFKSSQLDLILDLKQLEQLAQFVGEKLLEGVA